MEKKLYKEYKAKRKDATITKTYKQTTEKYVEVIFKGLPPQDYAKCKALTEMLEIGQYTNTTFNDIEQANYFITLLSGNLLHFIVKPAGTNFVVIRVR